MSRVEMVELEGRGPAAAAVELRSRAVSGQAPVPSALGSAAHGLLVGSAREVLALLLPHDPLGVRAVVARRLAARFLLMDGERAHLASVARIARGAGGYRGSPPLAQWIEREVDAALDVLCEEEARLERGRSAGGVEERASDGAHERGAWRVLALPLGLPPERMRAGCARFNALPREEREAFVRVVLERRSPDVLARESGRTLTDLARRARRGIEAVLAPLDAGGDEVDRGGSWKESDSVRS